MRRGGKYEIVGVGWGYLDVLDTLLKGVSFLPRDPLEEHEVDEHDR